MKKFNIAKRFPPKFFNGNPVEDILKRSEEAILMLFRLERSNDIYDRFDNDFSLFLSKLPNSKAKDITSDLFNKDLVFIGQSTQKKQGNIMSRVLLTQDDRFAGIVLNSSNLEIDTATGNCPAIDDCIYATYAGMIRATTIINEKEIKKDKELHKLLSTYIFLLYLKLIGKSSIISQKQKQILHVICVYTFYQHFLREKHGYIISILRREYVEKDIISEGLFNEIEPDLEKLKSYNNMKDLPKMITEFKIVSVNPAQFLMQMLKNLKPLGFYSLVGSLDHLISAIVLSLYPNSLIPKFMMTNEKIHNEIENVMYDYTKKVKFDINAVPKISKLLKK